MQTKFILEIYEPDSTHDPLAHFESDQPFMSIARGDLLNTRTWNLSIPTGSLFKVVGLEHLLWTIGDTNTHKLLVFTTEVKDSRESRICE